MSKRKFIKVRVNVTLEFFNQPKIPLGEEQVFEIPNITAQEEQEELEKRKMPPEYVPREGTVPINRKRLLSTIEGGTVPINRKRLLSTIEGGTVPRWRFYKRPIGGGY